MPLHTHTRKIWSAPWSVSNQIWAPGLVIVSKCKVKKWTRHLTWPLASTHIHCPYEHKPYTHTHTKSAPNGSTVLQMKYSCFLIKHALLNFLFLRLIFKCVHAYTWLRCLQKLKVVDLAKAGVIGGCESPDMDIRVKWLFNSELPLQQAPHLQTYALNCPYWQKEKQIKNNERIRSLQEKILHLKKKNWSPIQTNLLMTVYRVYLNVVQRSTFFFKKSIYVDKLVT